MRLIFLTMCNLQGVSEPDIYTDLMRKFRDEGHEVTIVSPRERRMGLSTCLEKTDGVRILGVRTLNLQKTNVVEKGIGQVLVTRQFRRAIRKHLGGESFDLILYSTPPITLMGVVKCLRKKNLQAMTYLLLKDIFPQNAVDLGMMAESGVKSCLYRYFRRQEKRLYQLSDRIGCMSPANVQYVMEHNPEIEAERVEVAPNSCEIRETAAMSDSQRIAVRQKHGLPVDRPVFIYGGNLGKPQGIPFLIRCLDANADRDDCHFVITGNGTEYGKINSWYGEKLPKSVSVFKGLPKDEYDRLVRACDVGLIFLDHRFTIPNYPSRLLSYLMERKPIIAATDPNTDVGTIAEANGYGFWCPSNDVDAFTACADRMLAADMSAMGEAGYRFFMENYTVEHTYGQIMKHLQ